MPKNPDTTPLEIEPEWYFCRSTPFSVDFRTSPLDSSCFPRRIGPAVFPFALVTGANDFFGTLAVLRDWTGCAVLCAQLAMGYPLSFGLR